MNECVQCGKASDQIVAGADKGTWRPGEYLLFGMLYACSVPCAFAIANGKCGGIPPDGLEEVATGWTNSTTLTIALPLAQGPPIAIECDEKGCVMK